MDRWSWWLFFLFKIAKRSLFSQESTRNDTYSTSSPKRNGWNPQRIDPLRFEKKIISTISTKTCSWLLGESKAVSFQGRFFLNGYSHSCPWWIFRRICTQGHRSQWKSDWTAMGWWVWVSPIPSCGGSIWHTLGSLGIQGHRNWGSEFGNPRTDLKHQTSGGIWIGCLGILCVVICLYRVLVCHKLMYKV